MVRGVRAYHSSRLHTQELRLLLLTDVVNCYENSDTNTRTQVHDRVPFGSTLPRLDEYISTYHELKYRDFG